MTRREDILNAIAEADRLHETHNSQARTADGQGRIDVFEMLVEKDIPILFRPLKNLLGAFVDVPAQGVMITTQRPLPVQRFTAAHELGHAALGHEASYDEEEVLTRALFYGDDRFDSREIQANAFAMELLTPRWLIAQHMRRQGWQPSDTKDPKVVYQLSLRMGSSYTATVFALKSYKIISESAVMDLQQFSPKQIKQQLIKEIEPKNWYGDIWMITEKDQGLYVEGSRSDFLIIDLQEHAASGYLWQFDQLADAGLVIRSDQSVNLHDDEIGGVVQRIVTAESDESVKGVKGHLNLREVRPWNPEESLLNSVDLDIDLLGPVRQGLHPKQLKLYLGAA
ncbi:MAG: ImmA/IrrE family metallo-endopeptidase [Pirellula sp.]